jgi:hypothetical protein
MFPNTRSRLACVSLASAAALSIGSALLTKPAHQAYGAAVPHTQPIAAHAAPYA